MRVTAIKEGFDGQAIRRPGDEFDVPDGAKGSWFEPVQTDPEPKRRKAPGKGDAAPGKGDAAPDKSDVA